MTALLGAGDSFHLVPRSYALWTTGMEANAAALGIGKFITSVTMTVFYLILYYIWRERYQIRERKTLTGVMWFLACLRIGLCLLPQNEWLSYHQPDPVFRFMPLAAGLSFGFYLPVVLFSGAVPAVGMLMIPKTLAYVWMIWMARRLYKEETIIRHT